MTDWSCWRKRPAASLAAKPRTADYHGSREELTPGGGDLLAGLPVALTALAMLLRPAAWRSFASGSTGAYSLTPAAWEQLRRAGAAVGAGPPGA